MSATESTAESHLLEHRRSVLSLRWLLIILGCYLTLFPRLGSPNFIAVFGFAIIFALTNVGAGMIRRSLFDSRGMQIALTVADIVFVCSTFFLLRGHDTYLYLSFVAVFLLAVVWRDLKILVFSIFAVSLLYGIFTGFRMFRFELDAVSFLAAVANATSDVEQFLTLSMFFLVAVFYLFLTAQMRHDAHLSGIILEEKRRAEVMAEITRSLSSSLNSKEILYLIATRLCDVTGAAECSIMRMNAQGNNADVVARSAEPDVSNTAIDIADYPEMLKAQESKELLFVSNVDRDHMQQAVIVAPMVVQDSVLGLIHLRFNRGRANLSDSDMRFLKVMSGTAANALRNAQLFEDMEHRARTDFLTDLPNHRFFQSQLSAELGRAQRHNHPLSLLIIDLDHLKKVNDDFGHPSGDMVIRGIAETIRNTCREFDFAARYGGEEFTVILPETPLTGAIQVAERIRERIATQEFPGVGSVTASIECRTIPLTRLAKKI